MSWTKRVKHPSKVVAIGDIVETVILDIDIENKRISLGMKQIETNPWELLQERYPVGSVVRGKIRNITNFGLFIGIEEGIDGLIHVSDLSWSSKIKNPADVFEKGEEIEAVVLHIDVAKERFSLGVKQLSRDPWEVVEDRYPPGSVGRRQGHQGARLRCHRRDRRRHRGPYPHLRADLREGRQRR